MIPRDALRPQKQLRSRVPRLINIAVTGWQGAHRQEEERGAAQMIVMDICRGLAVVELVEE